MKKAELLILDKMISSYIVGTRKELAVMQSEAKKLKDRQQLVHSEVLRTSREAVDQNIEQYVKSEVNFRMTERIFNKLNDNLKKRDLWTKIQLQLQIFRQENDTSVDVRIDTVDKLPKTLEQELLSKLIVEYERIEEYEICAFLMKKLDELALFQEC